MYVIIKLNGYIIPKAPMSETRPPIIGITMDHETVKTYSKYPWYALRENYAGCIAESGGVPIALPYHPELVETYLSMIDGLVITGGNFDVSPTLYGAEVASDTVTVKNTRTAFEYQMVKGALKRNMPIFGICGGQQLLNVVLGGTLIQHIPDVITSDIAHEQPNPRHEAGHTIRAVEGTMLASLIGIQDVAVNSAHHQAVDTVAEGIIVNAFSPDGVIEGIEMPSHPFCLGVQWHPEFFISSADEAILLAFILASQHFGAMRS
jgi:putative glutamine amidotransferase